MHFLYDCDTICFCQIENLLIYPIRYNKEFAIKITFFSDTHGCHNKVKIPEHRDIIVNTGDVSRIDSTKAVIEFLNWLSSLWFKHTIFIYGNNEKSIEGNLKFFKKACSDLGIHLLKNELLTIGNYKFYGIPSQRPGYNEVSKQKDEERLRNYKIVPSFIDVLLTHGPPFGILDKTCSHSGSINVGDEILRDQLSRINPKLCAFGHIHEGYGSIRKNGTLFVNSSVCNEFYKYVNEPITIDLKKCK